MLTKGFDALAPALQLSPICLLSLTWCMLVPTSAFAAVLTRRA